MVKLPRTRRAERRRIRQRRDGLIAGLAQSAALRRAESQFPEAAELRCAQSADTVGRLRFGRILPCLPFFHAAVIGSW
jgi:hypothetical protein